MRNAHRRKTVSTKSYWHPMSEQKILEIEIQFEGFFRKSVAALSFLGQLAELLIILIQNCRYTSNPFQSVTKRKTKLFLYNPMWIPKWIEFCGRCILFSRFFVVDARKTLKLVLSHKTFHLKAAVNSVTLPLAKNFIFVARFSRLLVLSSTLL